MGAARGAGSEDGTLVEASGAGSQACQPGEGVAGTRHGKVRPRSFKRNQGGPAAPNEHQVPLPLSRPAGPGGAETAPMEDNGDPPQAGRAG